MDFVFNILENEKISAGFLNMMLEIDIEVGKSYTISYSSIFKNYYYLKINNIFILFKKKKKCTYRNYEYLYFFTPF